MMFLPHNFRLTNKIGIFEVFTISKCFSSAVLRKSFLFISLLAMVAAQDAVVEEAAPAEAPAEAPAVAPVAPPAPPVAAAVPAKHEPSGWDGAATTSQ